MVGESVRRGLLVGALAAVASASIGYGQSVPVDTRPEATTVATSGTAGVVNAESGAKVVTVSVDVANAPLVEVLRTIARQAGLRMSWDDNVVQAAPRVSLRVRNVAADVAFAKVLSGTGMQAVIVSDRVNFVKEVAVGAVDGIIVGKVVDGKSRLPIRGATVLVDGATKGVVSGNDGVFRIGGVAAGEHTLRVRMLGYAKIAKVVTVVEGQSTTADVMLEPSINALDQVVVTGTVVPTSLKAVPNAITVITAKELEQRGITHLDQLFRGDVPGVWAQEQGSNGTSPGYVRMESRGPVSIANYNNSGLAPAIKTYVDGIELADPSYLGLIDPRSIERVEILTGPQASTIYGSGAINGVMQVFTKRGKTPRPEFTLSLQGGATQNNLSTALAPAYVTSLQMSGVDSHLSYSVLVGWNYTGSWTPAIRGTTISGSGGFGYQQGPLNIDASIRQISGIDKESGNPQAGETAGIIGGDLITTGTAGFEYHQRNTREGQTLGGAISYTPWSWWSNTLRVGTDRLVGDDRQMGTGYVNPADTSAMVSGSEDDRITVSYGTTARIEILPQTALNVLAGADGTHSTASTLYLRAQPSLQGGFNNCGGYCLGGNRYATYDHGWYAQSQLSFRDVVFLTYAVRAQYNPLYGKDANPNLQPTYGVSYVKEAGPMTVKLRASYGHSTTPPDRGASSGHIISNTQNGVVYPAPLYDQLPNPDLVPKEQRGGEGGVEMYWANVGSLVVTRFNQTVTHEVIGLGRIDSVLNVDKNPDPYNYCVLYPQYPSICGTGAYYYQFQSLNIGDLRNQGWEMVATANTGPLSYRLTYSFTKSRMIGVTEKYRHLLDPGVFAKGSNFSDIPEHTYATQVRYARAGTTMMLNLQGQSMVWKQTGSPYGCYGNDLDAVQLSQCGRRFQTRNPHVSPLSTGYRGQFPGYAKADLNITQRMTPRLEGTLRVQNVANSYTSDLSRRYAVAGRATNLGLTLRF